MKWVKFKDAEPDLYQRVIMFMPCCKRTKHHKHPVSGNEPRVETVRWAGDIDSQFSWFKPTHWMPLPEFPDLSEEYDLEGDK